MVMAMARRVLSIVRMRVQNMMIMMVMSIIIIIIIRMAICR